LTPDISIKKVALTFFALASDDSTLSHLFNALMKAMPACITWAFAFNTCIASQQLTDVRISCTSKKVALP
jgi:hypothetical protein